MDPWIAARRDVAETVSRVATGFESIVMRTWEAGRALHNARKHAPHGAWQPFLKEMMIARSTAHAWISFYKKVPDFKNLRDHPSVYHAMKARRNKILPKLVLKNRQTVQMSKNGTFERVPPERLKMDGARNGGGKQGQA